MMRNVIDAITSGTLATQILDTISSIPVSAQSMITQALPSILQALNYPTDWTLQQLTEHLTSEQAAAPTALITALIAIVLFASLRGIFAFLQSYWAEKNSQSLAYDVRNDLYDKIQKLSFSYHDRIKPVN